MQRYETVYILKPDLNADSLTEINTKISDTIKKLKGTVVNISEWGRRKLAYEIKRFDKGHYVLIDFQGLPGIAKELERGLRLDDRVLKYLTVKVDGNTAPEQTEKGREQIQKAEEEN